MGVNLIDTITKELSDLETKYAGQEFLPSVPYSLNFYKVLGLSSKELIHSKFIKFLLNPEEKHGYERDFLQYFIEILREKDENIPSIFECVKGKNEKKIREGRLDIYLENNQKKAIIIENKIHAPDQYRQLERYYDHYEDNNKPILIYLTLNGKEASRRSLGKLTEKNYSRLSYEDDIIKWLNKCANFIINKNPSDTKMLFLLTEYLVMVTKITKHERERKRILPILATDKETLDNVFKIWDELIKNKKSSEIENFKIKKKISSFMFSLKAYIIKEKFCKKNDKDTFLNKLCAEIGSDLRWKINEDRNIMQKGWGFKFYKDVWNDNHLDIKIVFEFRADNLRSCFYGLCKFDSINFKKDGWLMEPKLLTDGYSNWYRKVFLEFMDINTEKGLFSVLEDQIRKMIGKIEGHSPNQSPSVDKFNN